MKFYCHSLVLLISVAVATSSYFSGDKISRGNTRIIQEVVGELQRQQAKNVHHHVSHDHKPNHPDDHDLTNIRTANLIFKHNTVGRSKPRRGNDQQATALSDLICKLVGNCDIDLVNDGIVASNENIDDKNANNEPKPLVGKYYVNYRDNKRNTDNSNLENVLSYLAKAQVLKSGNNFRQKELADRIDKKCIGLARCQAVDPNNFNTKRSSDNKVLTFLKDLETALRSRKDQVQRCGCGLDDKCGCSKGRADKNNGDDMDEVTNLRCGCGKPRRTCKSCRTGRSGDSEEDDKTFLRCCMKCASVQYYQNDDGNLNIRDDEETDDKTFLRCCKLCGRSEYFRNVIIGTADSRKEDDSNEDQRYDNDDDKGKRIDIPDRAKVYPINENLDAIVIDVSELDRLLNAKNDNNVDNLEIVRELGSQKKNQILPLLQKGKMKQLSKGWRRNVKPDVEKYGLPFQLDIQGLGQINP